MVELKQVKLNSEVKSELDSLKYYENDSYSNVIKRIIEENKQLKEDKKQLYKFALANENSIAVFNNVHKVTYFIATVIEDSGTSEEEQLQVLKTYLENIINSDPNIILDSIEILKDLPEGLPNVLVKFENYVKTSF